MLSGKRRRPGGVIQRRETASPSDPVASSRNEMPRPRVAVPEGQSLMHSFLNSTRNEVGAAQSRPAAHAKSSNKCNRQIMISSLYRHTNTPDCLCTLSSWSTIIDCVPSGLFFPRRRGNDDADYHTRLPSSPRQFRAGRRSKYIEPHHRPTPTVGLRFSSSPSAQPAGWLSWQLVLQTRKDPKCLPVNYTFSGRGNLPIPSSCEVYRPSKILEKPIAYQYVPLVRIPGENDFATN